jgi:hypothetical protein
MRTRPVAACRVASAWLEPQVCGGWLRMGAVARYSASQLHQNESGDVLALNFPGRSGIDPWRMNDANAAKTPSDFAHANWLQGGCDQPPVYFDGKGRRALRRVCRTGRA